MWADILYGLLWTITVCAVVFTFILAKRLRRNSDIPIERLFVMTFALLVGIAMSFMLLSKQLHSTDNSEGPSLKRMDHYGFVKQIYPPLITAQNKLSHQVKQLNDLQKQVMNLRGEHPQQGDRLQFAYDKWLEDRKDLSQIKLNLDRSVRNAWIQHKTQDKKVIASEFTRQAVDWEKFISDRLDRLQDSQLKVSNSMLDNVMLQNRNLSRIRRGKNANFATSGAVFKSAFSAKTTSVLLDYYRETSPESAEAFDALGNEINIASQRGQEVRNYALENPDLSPTLDKVAAAWLQLENKSIYYRDQILHAVQSEYLAVILGTNKRDNQLKRLSKTLEEKILALSVELNKSRTLLERSYNSGSR